VVAAAVARIPEARAAYEQGSWDALVTRLDEIRASITALPDATRDAAARKLDPDLKPLEALAAPVAAMKAIRDGKDDGPVKADRLREVISTLTELKGRDAPLHRALRAAIADVDPETRKPMAGLKLPKQSYDGFVEAFHKGSGLERIGNPDDTTVVEFQDAAHRYAIRIVGRPPQILVEVDRVRLLFPVSLLDNREVLSLEAAAELSRALRATRHPKVFAESPWGVRPDAPGLCAWNTQDKVACVFLGGRMYEGPVNPDPDTKGLVGAFVESAQALEQAVRGSGAVPEEIKGPISELLKASYASSSKADHLDGRFCREAVQEGYLEAQLPRIDEAVAARLKEYRRTYGEVSKLRPRFEAKAPDGASATLLISLDNDTLWRVIDPASNTTTFSSVPRDGMGSALVAVSVFAGAHQEFPAGAEPIELRMSQGVTGVISRWTPDGAKLEFDPARWAKAVSLGAEGSIPEHFGSGAWQIPPHALKVDARGQARELIVPSGALDLDSFVAVAAGPARREAQDKFLQRCSEVLHSPGEYHLLYRYFIQYVLDSPVTTATTLIGSSHHCGDAHQDAYQTLDRRVNGKFLSDCDDLAELYWTILRRQNRPAFVLGVPGHATCGVAEKDGDGWLFFCVDTGPARQLKGPDLDGVVEKLLRTYDDEGDMAFDPRQMRFLFRFAGEQTRSDYYLDSRILRDAPYADLAIRCRSTGTSASTRSASRRCQGARDGPHARQLPGDRGALHARGPVGGRAQVDRGGHQGARREGPVHRAERRHARRQLLARAQAQGRREEDAQVDRRIDFQDPGGQSRGSGALPQPEIHGGDEPGRERPSLGRVGPRERGGRIADGGGRRRRIPRARARKDLPGDERDRAGRDRADREAEGGDEARQGGARRAVHDAPLQGRRFQHGRGAQVRGALPPPGERARARESHGRADQAGIPEGREQAGPEGERGGGRSAGPFIRLSPVAYVAAARAALVLEDPGAGGPKVAIAVVRALDKALPEIRRLGSLGTLEFSVLDLELLRACLEMDEKGIRTVFDEMKRQGWGQLYEDLSRTLGSAAEFMKIDDFEKVFRIYCEYSVPRRHYYGVVYAASEADRRGHALAASKICIERFPNDADMRREHELLTKLAK
jgi:hypothetical protein